MGHRSAASRRLAAAISAVLGASVPIAPVWAQEAPPSEGPLEEIVVTASRREASIQDIPFNIAALGPESIERLRITDLSKFTRAVPGLYVADQGPRNSNLMTVRGLNVSSLNASESNGNGTGGTVATYLGDIPLFVDLKMYDLERVEALLGPQGTLYGAGTLGGAIRYIPARPDPTGMAADFGGRAYTIGESDGVGADLHGMVNVPLVADKLALRVAAGYLDDPGFTDYDYVVREPGVSNPQPDFSDPADVAANLRKVGDADNEETFSGRVGLFWQVTDAFDANLTYYYQDQEVGGRTINHKKAMGTGPYVSAYRFLEPNEKTNQLLALELTWDLGFAELTSATGGSKYETDGQRDQTDVLLDFEYGYEGFPNFVAYATDTSEEKTFNEELRLVSQGNSRWNWIVGAFYNRYELDSRAEEHTPGFPEFAGFPEGTPDLEYQAFGKETFEEKALFGELGYDLTDRWQVTAGARWFEFDDELDLQVSFPFVDFTNRDQNRTSDDDVIFKFNTSYDFTDDVMGYLTVSEGYRRGGINSGPPCPSPVPPEQSFCLAEDEVLIKPDKTINYEVGMHSTWVDGALLLNVAAYYIDWDDIQVLGTSEVGGVPIIVNGSSAESLGVELTGRWNITDALELSAAASYNQAELTEDAPGLVDGADAFAGDRLAGTPEVQGTMLLAYTRPLNNGLTLTADYSLTATSDVYTKVGLRNNGEVLGGYAVHGAAIGLAGDRWSARLYADNLFDKYAVTSVRRDTSYIRQVPDPLEVPDAPQYFDLRLYFESPLRPRTIGLEFGYRFDL